MNRQQARKGFSLSAAGTQDKSNRAPAAFEYMRQKNVHESKKITRTMDTNKRNGEDSRALESETLPCFLSFPMNWGLSAPFSPGN